MTGNNFKNLENAATIMVRSEALSQEDKTTLGTIRRYGIVADALIMLGGLAGELKSGGIKTTYGGGEINKDLDDDDETDTKDETKLNTSEVKKYLKLSKDSLQDIYNVVKPVLNK